MSIKKSIKKSKKNLGIAIVFCVLMFILLLNYTHTNNNNRFFHSKCERYHNWAWIHAPRDGLVSQVNDLDGI